MVRVADEWAEVEAMQGATSYLNFTEYFIIYKAEVLSLFYYNHLET